MFIRRTIYSEPKHTWGSKMVMPIPDVEVIDPRDFAPSKLSVRDVVCVFKLALAMLHATTNIWRAGRTFACCYSKIRTRHPRVLWQVSSGISFSRFTCDYSARLAKPLYCEQPCIRPCANPVG